jgi:hypothetical protein
MPDAWKMNPESPALFRFPTLSRKAIRVIQYKTGNRTETIKEKLGTKGYGVGFEGLLSYINDQLPHNEELGKALGEAGPNQTSRSGKPIEKTRQVCSFLVHLMAM